MPEQLPVYYFTEDQTYSTTDVKHAQIALLRQQKDIPSHILEHSAKGYTFRFVGVLLAGNTLYCILPKYTPTDENEPWEEVVGLMALLRIYAGRISGRGLVYEDGTHYLDIWENPDTFNEIAFAGIIIDNFLRYGIWTKEETLFRTGANGPADWPRTIEQTSPLLYSGNSLYTEVFSKDIRPHQDHIITQLHQYATHKYVNGRLSRLLGFGEVFYEGSPAPGLSAIGDAVFLLQALEREMRAVFSETEIRLLKALHSLVMHESEASPVAEGYLFGTTAFYRVWEDACKVALNDRSQAVKDVFLSPVWIDLQGNQYTNAANRLIPDIIWFDEDGKQLLIADAKYYLPSFKGGHVSGNPGIGDVTKQVLYQQVLQQSPLGKDRHIINAFIFPASTQDFPIARVSTHEGLWGFVWSNIAVWESYHISVLFVSPQVIFDCYQTNRTLL